MKTKQIGMSLLETMLAISLFSVLLISLYKSFNAIRQGAMWSRNTSINSKKLAQSFYVMQQDFTFVGIHYITNLFQSGFDLSKKKEELFNKNKSKTPQGNTEPSQKNEKEEKEKKKQEKIFAYSKAYFPEMNKEDNETIISFITSYPLLTNNNNITSSSKIIYRLQKKDDFFQLTREEDIYDPSKKIDSAAKPTSNKAYILLDKIKDPEFIWYIPEISFDLLKEMKKPEESEKIIQEKLENLTFIKQSSLEKADPDKIIEKNIYPAGLYFKGEYQIDVNKFIPFDIFFALPNYKFFIEYYLYFVEQLTNKENEEKKKNPPGA